MKTRIEQTRKQLQKMYPERLTLDDCLEEIIVLQIDETDEGITTKGVDGWFGVVNTQGIIAYFGTEEEALHYKLDFINRILNG